MTIADAIYQNSLCLPEEAGREALGFIVFLEGRYAAASAGAETAVFDQAGRQAALRRLDRVRIARGGKPIAVRSALYGDVRG